AGSSATASAGILLPPVSSFGQNVPTTVTYTLRAKDKVKIRQGPEFKEFHHIATNSTYFLTVNFPVKLRFLNTESGERSVWRIGEPD
ncbi:MAG: hypothetical protein AAFY66_19820, partial [Pseudomonadota bacterium]